MRWALAPCLIAAIGGSAAADEAEVAGVRIALDAPSSCPSAAAVAAKLETAIEGAALTPTSVHIAVTRTDEGFALELVIGEDRDRARSLHGAWCESVVDAAVLILSLALLPETKPDNELSPAIQAADAELPAVPPPPPTPEPEPPAGFEEDPPEVSAVAPAVPTVPISMSIGATTAVDTGSLPGLAPGAGVALAARRANLTLDLAAAYFPTQRKVVNAAMGLGGDINAMAVNIRGCRATGPVWLCIGGEMNALTGTGINNTSKLGRFFLWGFTGAARYQLQLGERVQLAASGEIVGHPIRPEFLIEGTDGGSDISVFKPGWLSARLWLVGQVVIF